VTTARLALTPGEPAGIGPDLILLLAQQALPFELYVIADPNVLQQRAQQLGLNTAINPIEYPELQKTVSADNKPATLHQPNSLTVVPVACATGVVSGTLAPANAQYVLNTLNIALQGCVAGVFDAMVTGPVHKGVINDAGIAFTGHTEYLAEYTGGEPLMVLTAEKAEPPLRVALATTHLPLAEVPAALNEKCIATALTTLHNELQSRFGIQQPHILVSGLNPHAGEGGHLGGEELSIIEPCLQRLRAEGLNLTGPLPADTLFTPHHLSDADAVLAMYHDQGLPVLKYVGFGNAVNVTLGLPIIRTSVDHGTALDKAGTGNIDSGSLQAALNLAAQLCHSQQKTATASAH